MGKEGELNEKLGIVGLFVIGMIALSGFLNMGVFNQSYSLKKSQVTKTNDNYTKKNSSGDFQNDVLKRSATDFTGRETIIEIDVKETSELTFSYNLSNIRNKLTLLMTDNQRFGYLNTIVTLKNEDAKKLKYLN